MSTLDAGSQILSILLSTLHCLKVDGWIHYLISRELPLREEFNLAGLRAGVCSQSLL